MKEHQNDEFQDGDLHVVTTMKKVMLYRNVKLVGCAGVTREKDFDYPALKKFALEKSGSKIEVA